MGGIGALLIPVAVAVLAYLLSKRQRQSGELLSARLGYYQTLSPLLNDLVCYMTFIGGWQSMSPLDVIKLKRTLDKQFHCAAPLFSTDVSDTYSVFTDRCFKTFNLWGQDAKILSSAYRRRGGLPWESSWDGYFAYPDDRAIPKEELEGTRRAYDGLVAALVRDIDITRARSEYTTSAVSLNAHAPQRNDIAASV